VLRHTSIGVVVDTSVGDVVRQLLYMSMYVLVLLGKPSTWISLLFFLLSVFPANGFLYKIDNVLTFNFLKVRAR
jgi:hypothetical protein